MMYNRLWNLRIELNDSGTDERTAGTVNTWCVILGGTSMAVKKATSTTKTVKTAKAEPAKAETKAVKAEPAKAAEKTVKAESAKKAIETKKDTTKQLETKAAVLVDTPAEKTAEKKTAAKTTAAKKTTAKKTTTAAKKTTAKKTTAAKTTAAKTTAKKTAAKKAEIKTEIFLQFFGKEYTQDEILQKVKDVWTYDLGNNVDDIKDVQLYLKPEESAAYYVVNGNTTGKVVL